MMILLVGPTDQEVAADQTARRVFDIGHVPIDIADVARALLPSPPAPEVDTTLSKAARPGPATAPPSPSHLTAEVAARLILRCDAVLRTPGASTDADTIVERARWEGKPVFRHHHDIPAFTRPSPAS
jgi:hypothetical protein